MPIAGERAAQLTFVETGPDHIIIDYSLVPPALSRATAWR